MIYNRDFGTSTKVCNTMGVENACSVLLPYHTVLTPDVSAMSSLAVINGIYLAKFMKN